MKFTDILYQKTNDELYNLAKLCYYAGAKRKDDLVGYIYSSITRPESLRRLWRKLDPLSQKAVAAAYHNDGEFNQVAFVAQFGSLPERSRGRWSWAAEPILFDLFVYNGHLPSELIPLLADLVPPPERFQVQGLANRPVALDVGGQLIDLICAETEQAGLHDLTAYLRLVDRGEIKVSASSARATIASIRRIMKNLLAGDFLSPPSTKNYRAGDTIRPFGLDVFAQEGGLVEQVRRTNDLAMTELGREFYQHQNPEILLQAFENWTQQGSFDELGRIAALKGLKAKGTVLTAPRVRREAIIEALSWCPVGVWIDIDDFYRAVKIWHFDFGIETTYYSNLYLGHKDHGSLYGETYWRLVKGLYINAIIWEYLGSIGAVDLLYTPPEGADFTNYIDFYYEDDYFSLFDGLKYFRINDLGAFLLGQAGEYVSAISRRPILFSTSPEREVVLTDPAKVTPNDQHLLEQMAVPLQSGRYRLNTQRLLTALEEGADLAHLTEFLSSRHAGPLPPNVLTWLETVAQHSRAFKLDGLALVIKVASSDLAEMVVTDPVLQKFCRLLDSKTIIIPANKERAFRAQLKTLEYILAH